MMNKKIKDLSGKKFGRLLVVDFKYIKSKFAYWECKCDCGNYKIIRGVALSYKATKSCGCLQTESRKKLFTKHNLVYSKEYKSWSGMKSRCSNPNLPGSEHYYGKGIKVCKRWGDFINFYNDMGPKPSGKHSIDRIDNDGNYEPSNCKWSTMEEQANNTSKNVLLTYKGKTQTSTQWGRELGFNSLTIRQRISRGWSVEKTLTKKPVNRIEITYNGITGDLKFWALKTGIPRKTLQTRHFEGWNTKKLLTQKVQIHRDAERNL